MKKPALSACSPGQNSEPRGEDYRKTLADRELAATERPGFNQTCWELATGLDIQAEAGLWSDHTQLLYTLFCKSKMSHVITQLIMNPNICVYSTSCHGGKKGKYTLCQLLGLV